MQCVFQFKLRMRRAVFRRPAQERKSGLHSGASPLSTQVGTGCALARLCCWCCWCCAACELRMRTVVLGVLGAAPPLICHKSTAYAHALLLARLVLCARRPPLKNDVLRVPPVARRVPPRAPGWRRHPVRFPALVCVLAHARCSTCRPISRTRWTARHHRRSHTTDAGEAAPSQP